MTCRVLKTLAVLAMSVFAFASRSDADVIPLGLQPGDKFRLVFVTSGTHNAETGAQVEYDWFVTTAANLNPELKALGATWKAIASSESATARDSIGSSGSAVGIYLLDGRKVAAGTGDLFDGSLGAPISIDEAGNFVDGQVWTGSSVFGEAQYVLGEAGPNFGLSTEFTFNWITVGSDDKYQLKHLYGISSEITYGAAPEPGSIGLTVLGGALLAFAARRKRQD